jgi:hypothetical protein
MDKVKELFGVGERSCRESLLEADHSMQFLFKPLIYPAEASKVTFVEI